jgi:thiol-disulfide isomerase/thioredoxin
MDMRQTPFVAAPAFLVGGCLVALAFEASLSAPSRGSALAPIDTAGEWLNTEPLSSAKLDGKVVLVSFWTYSCINWLRVQPYLRAWAEKYEDDGLVVIGVHTPEFSFEQGLDNVRWATRELRVDYPVVVDNDYAIWNSFRNQYWPAIYLVDATGRVRHEKFGEGDYELSERAIQQLLMEIGGSPENDLVADTGEGLELAADWDNLGTPETYLGADRTSNFAAIERLLIGIDTSYTVPDHLILNQWALSGRWTVGREYATVNKPDGRVRIRFHARDVNLVMAPARLGESIRFRVTVDGKSPAAAHGIDVDAEGYGTIREQRLHQLVRQPGAIIDRTVEIEFIDSGAELYSFTFG